MARIDGKARAEVEEELSDLAEGARVIARAVVEEVRQAFPDPSQWARARGLHEAREWFSSALAALSARDVDVEIETATIEAMGLRWARLIETGSVD